MKNLRIAFSEDGQKIASSSLDHDICVYDCQSNILVFSEVVFTDPDVTVTDVAISHDGRFVAASFNDGGVTVWNILSRNAVLTQHPCRGRGEKIILVGFLPGDKDLVLVMNSATVDVLPASSIH